jgi:hypothetical protein
VLLRRAIGAARISFELVTIKESRVDLPIKFPSDSEVILEDVARFRALTPREQLQAIRGLLKAGDHIREVSPTADWAKQYAEEQELLAQRNIREFIARHGCR